MPIIIILVLLLGGGTSVVAERSLPGDALYPIKTHVNEEVRGLFSVGAQAKASWDGELAIRRLREAEQLAVQSKLNTRARAELETRFEAATNEAQARIEAFASADADKAVAVIADLETSLKAHERILASIGSGKDGSQRAEVNALLLKVHAEVADSDRDLIDKEAEVKAGADVAAAAAGRQTAAEHKIAEVQQFISDNQARFDAQAVVQANARLKAAQDLLAQGNAQLAAKNYSQAFVLFGQAHETAQEAKLLVQAKLDFELDDGRPENGTVSPRPGQSGVGVEGSAHVESGDKGTEASGKVKINLGL